jgi:GNAT superfamily N-acetyltransferase
MISSKTIKEKISQWGVDICGIAPVDRFGDAPVFAFEDKKLIGMGRAICDGEYQAAIYDVVVLPEYQKKGIGKRIIEETCQKLPVANIILYAVPGKEHFYSKLGFKIMLTAMANLEPRLANPQEGYIKYD